jgi:hypothetical protein
MYIQVSKTLEIRFTMDYPEAQGNIGHKTQNEDKQNKRNTPEN